MRRSVRTAMVALVAAFLLATPLAAEPEARRETVWISVDQAG